MRRHDSRVLFVLPAILTSIAWSESSAAVEHYVRADATGAQTGATWADAGTPDRICIGEANEPRVRFRRVGIHCPHSFGS